MERPSLKFENTWGVFLVVPEAKFNARSLEPLFRFFNDVAIIDAVHLYMSHRVFQKKVETRMWRAVDGPQKRPLNNTRNPR